MKITDLCHTILNFAVLCSLLSDLCIDLPIATTGRTGLCVLQIGGGRGAYKKGIECVSRNKRANAFLVTNDVEIKK